MMTKEESAWVKKVQKLLNDCPSRFGFYTIGDHNITIYDRDKESLFDHDVYFCTAVQDNDAYLGQLIFPVNVNSTCG